DKLKSGQLKKQAQAEVSESSRLGGGAFYFGRVGHNSIGIDSHIKFLLAGLELSAGILRILIAMEHY
ncbi:MAG: hypothetical protein G5703_12345, partial [Serratia symbiotica]|nr:hypothetical protein [Serratia symbiotica]